MFSHSTAVDVQPDALDRDRLSSNQFNRFSELVRTVAGICIPPAKKAMLESRLRKRVKRLELSSLAQYCEYFFQPENFDNELPHLIDVVTTNKTDFFREREHYEALKTELVPALLKLRRAEQAPLIKVWSAASSTGAEAYSAAMLLASLREQGRIARFSILGTDISSEVLETATAAIYPEEMMAPVPYEFRKRYVLVGRKNGSSVVRIAPELRRYVSFQRLNLMDDRYPIDRDVDVIFLRNVLIYFDQPTQLKVSRQLSQHLRRGGYLILGHSEAAVGRNLDLTLISSGIYQRV